MVKSRYWVQIILLPPLLTENNTVVRRILVVNHGTTPDQKLHLNFVRPWIIIQFK
jgi:hypothetical protein